jgi:agmatine deiminase
LKPHINHPNPFVATEGMPHELGFSMPPEWAPHLGTWLSWPRDEGVSFPGKCPEVFDVYRQLVAQLAQVEQVFINVWDDRMIEEAEEFLKLRSDICSNVTFLKHPANEPWCRDHGPIFVTNRTSGEKALIDWGYNAWGEKYPPYDLDNAIPKHIAQLRQIKRFDPKMILEGGSIEVDGKGLLMTTESCLMNSNRNPHLSKQEIEQHLRDFLGISKILWLGDGIVGDDTDGHIDDMTRFIDESTIVTAVEADPADENYGSLKDNRNRLDAFNKTQDRPFRIVEIPMPKPVIQEGLRLPASYANFYIANRIVIVPTYNDPNDAIALKTIQELVPNRRVIGIDSTTLIWGLGSFHCITQQEPIEPTMGDSS